MPKGDILARGGHSAQFQQAPNQGELEADLKIHLPAYVCDKYGITKMEYAELVEKLNRGEALPELAPVEPPEPVFMPAVGEVPQFELEEIPQKVAQVGYRAKPFGDSILVTRVDKEHTSNLIIPDSMKGRSEIGFLVAVGDEAKKMQPGQLVLFDKFASHGADYKFLDEEGVERDYLILKEFDVLCSLEKITLSGQDQTQS